MDDSEGEGKDGERVRKEDVWKVWGEGGLIFRCDGNGVRFSHTDASFQPSVLILHNSSCLFLIITVRVSFMSRKRGFFFLG